MKLRDVSLSPSASVHHAPSWSRRFAEPDQTRRARLGKLTPIWGIILVLSFGGSLVYTATTLLLCAIEGKCYGFLELYIAIFISGLLRTSALTQIVVILQCIALLFSLKQVSLSSYSIHLYFKARTTGTERVRAYKAWIGLTVTSLVISVISTLVAVFMTIGLFISGPDQGGPWPGHMEEIFLPFAAVTWIPVALNLIMVRRHRVPCSFCRDPPDLLEERI